MTPSIDWQAMSLQLMTTFGHFLWQGTAIGILLAAILRLCSERSASSRYVVACAALALLPVCVVGTFSIVHHSGASILSAEQAVSQHLDASFPALIAEQTPLSDISSIDAGNIGLPSALPIDRPDRMDAVPAIQSETTWSSAILTASPYLFVLYLIGVAAMLIRIGTSIWSSTRLRLAVTAIEDAAIVRIIAEQAGRMGLNRIPAACLCQRISVPVVVGILKPMILLPPAILCGLDPQPLGAILSHEMAHIRRYDLLVNLLQRFIEALLFFHPVTWWISRRLSFERENCCDDMAVAGCGRLEFASALLQMAELSAKSRGLNIAPQLEALAADGGNPSQLSRRVRRLLGEVETPRLMLTRSSLAVFAIALTLGCATVFAFAQNGDSERSETDGFGGRLQVRYVDDDSDEPLLTEADILLYGALMMQENGRDSNTTLILSEETGMNLSYKWSTQLEQDGSSRQWGVYLDSDLLGVVTKFSIAASEGGKGGIRNSSLAIRLKTGAAVSLREFLSEACFHSPCQTRQVDTDLDGVKLQARLLVQRGDDRKNQVVTEWIWSNQSATERALQINVTGLETETRILKVNEITHLYVPIDFGATGIPAGKCFVTPSVIASGGIQQLDSTISVLQEGNKEASEVATTSPRVVFEFIESLPMRTAVANEDSVIAGARSADSIKDMEFAFRWCPPGEFLMGSAPGTEFKYGDRFEKQHRVKLARGFWMQETEVTQAQYAAIMGLNPSSWSFKMESHPAENVKWHDATEFCRKLTSLDPNYVYRLPTEAEWEYACRAGDPTNRYGDILDIAWVFTNTDEGEGSSGHRPVGTKQSNNWGLHDMFGNVAEWCSDWRGPTSTTDQIDPQGPSTGESRCVRGGDCFNCFPFLRSDGECMAGTRSGFGPDDASRLIGLRVVRTQKNLGTADELMGAIKPAALGDSGWRRASPHKVVWDSDGTTKIQQDSSVQLESESNWQDFTLFFRKSELPTQIQTMRLELLPSSNTRAGSNVMLFDVKPHLEDSNGKITHLEFADCKVAGNSDDDSAANCIDFLSDTGWKVPGFSGLDSSHQLVFKLAEPIVVDDGDMFGITIDAGGSPELGVLTRVRVSFADTQPTAVAAAETASKLKRAAPTTGQLVDESGDPIAGAHLYVCFSSEPPGNRSDPRDTYLESYTREPAKGQAVTDADGRFALNTLKRDNEYVLMAIATNHQPILFDSVAGGTDLKTSIMKPPLDFQGRIIGDLSQLDLMEGVDNGDRTFPFYNAITLKSGHGCATGLCAKVHSDGTFSIPLLIPGPLQLSIADRTFNYTIDKSQNNVRIDLDAKADEQRPIEP